MDAFGSAVLVAVVATLGNIVVSMIGYFASRRKQKAEAVKDLSATAAGMVDTALSLQEPMRVSLAESQAANRELRQENELLLAQMTEIQQGFDDARDALQYLAGKAKSPELADAVRIAFGIANRRTQVIIDPPAAPAPRGNSPTREEDQ